MANILPRQVEYIATESDMRQQVGKILSDRFIKDYVAIKQNIGASIDQTNANTQTIETLDSRLDVAEAQIVDLDNRVDAAEGDISALDGRVDTVETNLSNHVNAESAHGATGDIVGTGNYAQAGVGGVVLLANPVANAVASTVSVTSPDATAAPATYNQAQAQSVVTLVNEMKGDVNTLVANLNAAITQLNALLAAERSAKQLAP